ncbi:hypothetical protein TR66_26705 [Streptomyces sp. WM6391]|nr:hypothetical protein TR66_26705 [Streptomyces sp. WM6391]
MAEHRCWTRPRPTVRGERRTSDRRAVPLPGRDPIHPCAKHLARIGRRTQTPGLRARRHRGAIARPSRPARPSPRRCPVVQHRFQYLGAQLGAVARRGRHRATAGRQRFKGVVERNVRLSGRRLRHVELSGRCEAVRLGGGAVSGQRLVPRRTRPSRARPLPRSPAVAS